MAIHKPLSKKAEDFESIRIDKETMESIARVAGCHPNNFDWWEISQYVKDVCLEAEARRMGEMKCAR